MAASKQITQRKTRARSRVTNGKSLLPREVDQRSHYYRRFHDLVDLLSADLGGAHDLSISEAAIVRTAATHMVSLEQLEMRFALAEGKAAEDDLKLYTTLSNSLRRLLKELGVKRRAKDVTPDLQTYLRKKAAEREALTIDHDAEPRLNGHRRARAS
jgi:hypothetical protein